MEAVDPYNRARFCNSCCAVANNIAKGASRYATANGHWKKWAEFYQDMAFEPLLVSYQDLVRIINTFVRQYWTGSPASSVQQVQFCMVENAIRSIGQALAAMGGPDPCLKIQGNIGIRI